MEMEDSRLLWTEVVSCKHLSMLCVSPERLLFIVHVIAKHQAFTLTLLMAHVCGSRCLFSVAGYVVQVLGNCYKSNLVHIKNSDNHSSEV